MRVPVRLSVHSWSMFTVHSVSRVSVHSFIHSFVHSFIHPLHSSPSFCIDRSRCCRGSRRCRGNHRQFICIHSTTLCRRQKPKASFDTPYNMSQSGAGAEKQRSFDDGHRLFRAMNFELFFAQISCDQIKTRQRGTFDFMKLLKPAVSNKQNEAHDAHRPSAGTRHS